MSGSRLPVVPEKKLFPFVNAFQTTGPSARRIGRLGMLALLLLVPPVRAGEVKLEKLARPAPGEVSEEIRAALQAEGIRVLDGGKIVGEFWLRRDLPLKEASTGGLGVRFGRVPVGALLGVAHCPEGWSDYRNKPVAAGSYTLRYAIQPEDGNHAGVSVYRDFLLLIPASSDRRLDPGGGQDLLVRMSRDASGLAHPPVLGLFPVKGASGTPAPVRNEMDHWMVSVRAGSLDLGLVVLGHQEPEGY